MNFYLFLILKARFTQLGGLRLVRESGNDGYDVKVIDEKNWLEYIDLPDYIICRRERKHIPPAHFADLLRLELLIRYGGTWIDSTVLCTGFKSQDSSLTGSEIGFKLLRRICLCSSTRRRFYR